ncbi:hypothetical protein C8A01DRAFT_16110 [Parachaetomium inaequale]|uniref:Uncharacterized protein n=1 Tax=Parachaetomium inaequale TaxID=2588326 RepID=A0AAN6PK77_9PEZI|nr:hypothetical protein C8A01DRAFT_16110 [Parachaetomium inaequale]
MTDSASIFSVCPLATLATRLPSGNRSHPLAQQGTNNPEPGLREAAMHFDPDMDPLTDADSFSRVLRKGKKALDNIRREVSIKLWGADLPCIEGTRMGWPQPGVSVTADSPFLLRCRYLGFFFIHDIPAGEFRPAVVELTSEPTPVDNCIRFHAIEPDENRKRLGIASITRTTTITKRPNCLLGVKVPRPLYSL